AIAEKLWQMSWSLLKKPANVSVEEKQCILALESEDEGFVHRFRNIIRQVANIFMRRLLAFLEVTSLAWPQRHAIHAGVIVIWTGWDDERDSVRGEDVRREGFLPASPRAV